MAKSSKLHMMASCFAEAVRKTLQTQCSLEVLPKGPPSLQSGDYPIPPDLGAVGAVLELSGKDFQGTALLCFSQGLFLALLSSMFRQPLAELTAELEDSAPELLNMTFGIAKRLLEQKQRWNFQMAIPSLIKGPKLQYPLPSHQQMIIVPFSGQGGGMELRLSEKSPL